MAIFSGKVVSATFMDFPTNTVIEVLYREETELTSYILEVDFTQSDFNDLLQDITLEEIEAATQAVIKAEGDVFNRLVNEEIERRWALEQDKVKAAYDDAEAYAQKVIGVEYEKINSEYQKLEKASGEINSEYQKLEKATDQVNGAYDAIADEWKKIYEQWEKVDKASGEINQEYQKLERASGEINQEYQKLELEYKKVDTYAELEKSKKFKEVQEEFQKAREDLQTKFNLTPGSTKLDGKDVFAAIDQNNQDNDFVFNLKVSILEDPVIAKSRDKKLKLAIRKSKSVLDLLKIYAGVKEAS